MVNVVTILADHKGMTTPRVTGDEYYVDAKVNITDYRFTDTTGIQPTGAFTAATNKFVRASGDALSTLTTGQLVSIANADESGNNESAVRVTSVDGNTMFLGSVTTDDASDEVDILPTYEVLKASSFGLSTINALEVLGSESLTLKLLPVLDSSGDNLLGNTSAMEVALTAIANGANQAANVDGGMFLVRVYGNL